MIDIPRPPTPIARTPLPQARAAPERLVDESDILFIDCYNFKQYVADKDDIDGMIAYSFYQFQKIDFIEKNPSLPEEQLLRACKDFVSGRNFLENKEKARSKIAALERTSVAAFARQKTKRDLIIGIGAGLVASLLAPLFYSVINYLILSSGVTRSFS